MAVVATRARLWAGFGEPAHEPAGGGEGASCGGDGEGNQRKDGDGGEQCDEAGAPGVWLQQEQPPDADQGSGGDVPGDGAPGVAGGQFAGERVGDGLGLAELVDRGGGGLGGCQPGGDVGFGGVEEAVA